MRFEYLPSELDTFFSSVLPLPASSHCLSDMFVSFTEDHDVNSMIMTSSCAGLNLMGLSFPAGSLEHKITIILDEVIVIESNILDGEYQVNEFLKIQQPSSDYSISVAFYANGSISGEIRDANLFLFGKVISTTIKIADKATFTTSALLGVFSIDWEGQLFGVFDIDHETQNLIAHINSALSQGASFYNELNVYISEYIENAITAFNNRLEFISNSEQEVEKLFYFNSDMVTKLQNEFDELSLSYDEAVEIVNNTAQLLEQYQTEVNDLDITEVDEILSICNDGNCMTDCAVQETCSLCEHDIFFKHWGIGLTLNEEDSAVSYKKDVSYSKWTVGYFCRLITNIKSWGKTTYGQICSYKSEDIMETKAKWVLENKLCNISHFEAVEIDNYLVPANEICFSNQSGCGMHLQSSSCMISDSACNIAQLKMINSLEVNKQQQLQSLENLLETKSNLLIAQTQAEELRYRKEVSKCKLAHYHDLVKSLYGQLTDINNNREGLLIEFSHIQQIEYLLVNHSVENFVHVNEISFDVIVNGSTPASFPLMISFESSPLNASIEISVFVDFHSPRPVFKRDIASSIMNKLKEQMTNSRKRRSCDLAEPSHNEKRFEQYCSMLGNIKEYFIELNETLNTMIANGQNSKTKIGDIVTYKLLTYADKEVIPITIDMDKLNSYLNAPAVTEDDLLKSSLSSIEYVQVESSLQSVMDVTATIASTIDDTILTSWWVMLNNLHQTLYNRVIDEKKCFGFADCFKTVLTTFREFVDDSKIDSVPLINVERFNIAEEQALKLITKFIELNNTWDVLEPMYEIILEVDASTSWCSSAPILVDQPDANIYAEIGSTVELLCTANHVVAWYNWLKDGFPMKDTALNVLRLHSVGKSDEGQYQCLVSSEAGYTLSTAFELHVYSPPVLTSSPSNVITYEGNEDDALFVCDATGYPTPLYYWYFSNDKANWTMVGNGSNEYVVYKPTKASEGWYRCQASIHDRSIQSEAAFLNVLGASISKISYRVTFNMAIYSTDELHSSSEGYTQGLHGTLKSAIKRNDIWEYGFFENVDTTVDYNTSQLNASFHLSAVYDYSLTKSIADQALEADQRNAELLGILEKLNLRLRDASISFGYLGDFLYTFPQTFNSSDPLFSCLDGQELAKNTFICGKTLRIVEFMYN